MKAFAHSPAQCVGFPTPYAWQRLPGHLSTLMLAATTACTNRRVMLKNEGQCKELVQTPDCYMAWLRICSTAAMSLRSAERKGLMGDASVC